MKSDDVLSQLQHPDPQERIRALREALAQISAKDKEVWQRIEWMALYDKHPLVRQVALAALLTPEGQRYYEQWLSSLPWETFHSLKEDLEQRTQTGVVDPAAATVILDFFRQYEPTPPTRPLSPEELRVPLEEAKILREEEAEELRETARTPSETPQPAPGARAAEALPRPREKPQMGGGVRLLVYLGAFLVAAASLLLASAPGLRGIALFGGTGAFFLLAGVLWFVFRPGAAVFYGLATFYLWADAYVLLQDVLQLPPGQPRFWFLFATAVLVGLLWALGTRAFRSRFFALLTALAFPLGGIWLALALAPSTPLDRWVWGHLFVQGTLNIQWVWSWGLRRWDERMAPAPRFLTQTLATLHSLVFPITVVVLDLTGDLNRLWPLALITGSFFVLFFLLALVLWPWKVWDGLALGWSLFGLPLPWALIHEPPQLIFAGFGLAYALLGLTTLSFPHRWRKTVLYWALVSSGWGLMLLGGLPNRGLEWTWQGWVVAAAGLLIYSLHTWIRDHAILWVMSLLLFMYAYVLFLDFTRLGASLYPALRALPLVALTGLWPPVWRYRHRPTWMWATLVPTLALVVVVALMGLNIPIHAWVARSVVFTGLTALFLFWAFLLQQPFWALGSLLFILLSHASLLTPTPLWDYWPATYLPYPFLFLALDYLLAPRPDDLSQSWRWSLRIGAWSMMFVLAWPALGVDNNSTALVLFLWALVYIHYALSLANPWPSLLGAVLIFLATAHALSLREVVHASWWISGVLGGLALLLFALFRRYGHAGWATVWALLGQAGMYTAAFLTWLMDDLPPADFQFLFSEAVLGLLLGMTLGSGIWVWPGVVVMSLSVAIAVIASMGETGVLLVVCGTGLILLGIGLYALYRRTRS